MAADDETSGEAIAVQVGSVEVVALALELGSAEEEERLKMPQRRKRLHSTPGQRSTRLSARRDDDAAIQRHTLPGHTPKAAVQTLRPISDAQHHASRHITMAVMCLVL